VVDALKLDRFFVAGIDRNAEDPAIVRAVIDLAHSLGLHAVAEGVETIGQLEALTTMGCDYAQGFLFSPSVRADKVEALLAAATLVPAPQATRSYAGTGWTLAGLTDDADLAITNPVSVLVIDDSDGERGLLYGYLEGSGSFRVVGDAADGETGVALVARTKPDLVLLDMSMPGMDGLETLPLVLHASPTTRVVIFSGFVSAGLRDQAIAGGAVAVLDKDAPFATIVAQLRSLASLPPSRDTAAGRRILPFVATT
jgi:CheY-like chemotaxis protein